MSTQQTLSLKTHKFLLTFSDGWSMHSYSEDDINHEAVSEKDLMICGVQKHLEKLSGSGMVDCGKNSWRPNCTIKGVTLLESTTTRVVQLELNDTYDLWEIISED